MADLTRELNRHLREAGCRFQRQGRGDHETWYSPRSQRYSSVDYPIKSRHTANAVLNQAGLDKFFWEHKTSRQD